MSEAKKFDEGKPNMDLLSPSFLEGMARVAADGAEKYGIRNYLKGATLGESRVVAAVMRHLNSYRSGEDKDKESGMSHILHAAVGLMILHEIIEKDVPCDLNYRRRNDITKEIEDWAKKVIHRREPSSTLSKLAMEEFPELLLSPDDPEEYADVFILLMESASLRGIDVFDATRKKMSGMKNFHKDPVTGRLTRDK